MKNAFLLYACFLISAMPACRQQPAPAETPSGEISLKEYFRPAESGIQTGGVKMVEIESPKGKFKVWTKRIGNNPKIKLLLLHGGPGVNHDYFECMESFLPQEGIEFIYYDQLGSGYSDIPQDTSLWELDRFVEEVEQVRQALGLTPDNFYLLGHSWGGILAAQYALKYQQNLKGLIISNMMMDCPAYDRYAAEVLGPQMEPDILKQIQEMEAKKDFKNPAYMDLLMNHFYTRHICRIPLESWPEPVNRAFSKLNEEVYVTMQGPSEFGISGRLENWNIMDQLPAIQVPTLVIAATHDTMDPAHMKKVSETLPKGQFLLCANGSHMCMWDDQQTYMSGLIKFLKEGN
ncbi:MAG TPA: proline iminopeptidase-family hydrolase [Saprospiraceae bacterium]|nr:proline iminopeptidase-family hydrolase [Saprospiraceae bacterium]